MAPPREIVHEAGALLVQWEEGRQRLPYEVLRCSCPCAFCRAQCWQGQAIAATPEVRVTSLKGFGYGVQIVFSDGHDRGIFPWDFMRSLAPLQPGLAAPAPTGPAALP